MRTLTYNIPPECDGNNVGHFLRSRCGLSARMVTRLKQTENGILMNGVHVRTVDALSGGGTITLNIPDDARPASPTALSVPVVYADEDIIVMDKPAGMPVHPSHNHQGDTLANAYAYYLSQKGESGCFRPINRLDRDTTGLVLICRHAHSANLMRGKLEKEYYAVCEGLLEGSGVIDAPIRRAEERPDRGEDVPGTAGTDDTDGENVPPRVGRSIKREVGEGGQRAVTHWRAISQHDGMTLCSIRLETGRTHQIRTHFSCCLGMPLAGDDMYGGSREKIQRQALHCGLLEFDHPVTGEHLSLRSPLPEDMRRLMN